MRLFEDRMTTIFFDVDKDGNKQVAIRKLDNIKTIGVVQLPLESFDIIWWCVDTDTKSTGWARRVVTSRVDETGADSWSADVKGNYGSDPHLGLTAQMRLKDWVLATSWEGGKLVGGEWSQLGLREPYYAAKSLL